MVDTHPFGGAAGRRGISRVGQRPIHGHDLALEPILSRIGKRRVPGRVIGRHHLRGDGQAKAQCVGPVFKAVVRFVRLNDQVRGIHDKTDRVVVHDALAVHRMAPRPGKSDGSCCPGRQPGQHAGRSRSPVYRPLVGKVRASLGALVGNVRRKGHHLARLGPALLTLGTRLEIRDAADIVHPVSQIDGRPPNEGDVQVYARWRGARHAAHRRLSLDGLPGITRPWQRVPGL